MPIGQNSASSSSSLTGVLAYHLLADAQGWVRLDGRTIGGPNSGATSRANGDTADLYRMLWNNFGQAVLAIQTSAGAASVRGASADADFIAGKRLPLLAVDGDFIRAHDATSLIDVGRVIGTHQAGQFPAHAHNVSVQPGTNDGANVATTDRGNYDFSNVRTTSSAGGTNNASENRPPNTAFPFFAHL